MRNATWVIGVAVVLTATVGFTRGDEADYSLRGPAPVKGQTVVSKSIFKISNADVTIKLDAQNLKAKQTLTATTEEEIKVVAFEGRQVTNAQTKMIRETVDTVTTIGGEDKKETKAGALESKVIISERTGAGKWKHGLVDSKPTEKQKKDLDKRVGPENEDDLYPDGKVKIGHSWTVEAAALQRMFGGSITDLKGKLKMTFTRVEELDGELCAVVEATGTITGIAKEDEGDLNVELKLKGTTWRSIKTGIDLKDRAEGRIKLSGKIKVDGAEVELTLEGPMTISSSAKLKAD